jgi:hypothetical protein
MNLNLRGMMLMMAAVMGLLFSGEARAQNCSTFMQDKLTWMSGSGNYLYVQGSSVNATQGGGWGLVSYVEGWITGISPSYTYYDYVNRRYVTVPARIRGDDLSQTFSDRNATGYQPFDRNQADRINLSIDANGKIYITLVSWGNGTVTVEPTTCANGLIYGFSSDGSLWSFTFVRQYLG